MTHQSVLLKEVIDILQVNPHGVYVDATVGGGGHTAALAERLTTGCVIGIDCDASALARAKLRLAPYGEKIKLVQANFRNIDSVLAQLSICSINGAIFDLGVSSFQLDSPDRGFSFRSDALLDMRMDRQLQLTAADAVNTLTESELTKILFDYGGERYAKRIARAIASERAKQRIHTTFQLADLIEKALPKAYIAQSRIHPSTRTFQALRIYLNDELTSLRKGLNQVWKHMVAGGVLAVISFHSLENRIVKAFFREKAARCVCPPGLPICACQKISEAKVGDIIKPLEEEIRSNPRSRSATLRSAVKLAKRQ